MTEHTNIWNRWDWTNFKIAFIWPFEQWPSFYTHLECALYGVAIFLADYTFQKKRCMKTIKKQ